MTAYQTRCIRLNSISAGQIKKENLKQTINIKRDKINIMNMTNDNTFNQPFK